MMNQLKQVATNRDLELAAIDAENQAKIEAENQAKIEAENQAKIEAEAGASEAESA